MCELSDAAEAPARRGGGKTVLVAEDDVRLRQITGVRLVDPNRSGQGGLTGPTPWRRPVAPATVRSRDAAGAPI